MNNHIFALDIGTRSVTGILLSEQGRSFTLIDLYTKEHEERSMIDGQIHDVVSVAKVIQEVKETLEDKHGPLHHVSVAAAGRALKTIKATASIPLQQQRITDEDTIKHLELSAVQRAQQTLIQQEQTDHSSSYSCVGYSTLYYTLDGEVIGSLIDQYGDEAAVEVIATFLPTVVVESLISALQRAGLGMQALTLEPIAAIHVLIPESMRRLNVALVDIGAGTSDIALTKQGAIVAYGMVPQAGDQITEAISDAYILDFPQAEQAKKEIVTDGKTLIEDILGFQTEVTLDDVIEQIDEQINTLTSTLSHEILELNGKPPQAIMLIGGGSLSPQLTKRLAEQIGLPHERVAVRGVDAIQSLTVSEQMPVGPDYVTPIGIAITSKQNPVQYVHVTVNDQPIRMFEMNQVTAFDALIQAGIELQKLYGKPGLALFITINGKSVTIPGQFGTAPLLFVNGKEAHTDTPIEQHDAITVERGEDGSSLPITLDELIGESQTTTIQVNDQSYELAPRFYVNGKKENVDYLVQDRDAITIKKIETVHDVIQAMGKDMIKKKPFSLFVNNERVHLSAGDQLFFVNDKQINEEYRFAANDRFRVQDAVPIRVQDVLNKLEIEVTSSINILFNGAPIQLSKQVAEVTKDNVILSPDTILERDVSIAITKKPVEPFIFQDVFRYVDIDLTTKTGSFSLLINDLEATFFEPLAEGDQLSIIWHT